MISIRHWVKGVRKIHKEKIASIFSYYLTLQLTDQIFQSICGHQSTEIKSHPRWPRTFLQHRCGLCKLELRKCSPPLRNVHVKFQCSFCLPGECSINHRSLFPSEHVSISHVPCAYLLDHKVWMSSCSPFCDQLSVFQNNVWFRVFQEISKEALKRGQRSESSSIHIFAF